MKIGILTFHRAHNYGAVLQCYALSNVLTQIGHKVEIIDYCPSYFNDQYSPFSHKKFSELNLKSKISYLLKSIVTYHTKTRRHSVFNEFITKMLPLSTEQYDETCDSISGYDAIIWGSDQIWNPKLTFGQDNVYSGKISIERGIKIAYAASTSPLACVNEMKPYFETIIKEFQCISVREISLMNYLNRIAPGCSRMALDPVFLLNEKSWSRIAVEPSTDNYLLVYTVPQSLIIWEYAHQIATKHNLKIVEIRPNVKAFTKHNVLQTVSPQEFLGYFKKASFILTTSFHGTAFSIIYKKQFLTIGIGNEQDDRARNILTSLGIENRLMPPILITPPDTMIDYSVVEKYLSSEIAKSKDYLTDSIKNGAKI